MLQVRGAWFHVFSWGLCNHSRNFSDNALHKSDTYKRSIMHSPYNVLWQILKLIKLRTKKYLLLEINIITNFYWLGWNILLTRVECLIIANLLLLSLLLILNIYSLRKWGYSFIYYLIAQVISSYQSYYCFLMSSEIFKKYREY